MTQHTNSKVNSEWYNTWWQNKHHYCSTAMRIVHLTPDSICNKQLLAFTVLLFFFSESTLLLSQAVTERESLYYPSAAAELYMELVRESCTNKVLELIYHSLHNKHKQTFSSFQRWSYTCRLAPVSKLCAMLCTSKWSRNVEVHCIGPQQCILAFLLGVLLLVPYPTSGESFCKN